MSLEGAKIEVFVQKGGQRSDDVAHYCPEICLGIFGYNWMKN
jgi:hypothetical protein